MIWTPDGISIETSDDLVNELSPKTEKDDDDSNVIEEHDEYAKQKLPIFVHDLGIEIDTNDEQKKAYDSSSCKQESLSKRTRRTLARPENESVPTNFTVFRITISGEAEKHRINLKPSREYRIDESQRKCALSGSTVTVVKRV
jgi:hypothetical protein